MPIYSNDCGHDCEPDFGPDCLPWPPGHMPPHHRPLLSPIGFGPKGDDGHSIGVEVVPGDPYGCYRIRFRDLSTDEVLLTTPNLDHGARTYVCSREFDTTEGTVHTAARSDFTSRQLGMVRDVRAGDLVVFKGRDEDDIRTLGIGIVTSVSSNNDTVTFESQVDLDPGDIADSVDAYVDRAFATLTERVDDYLANAKREQDEYIAEQEGKIDDELESLEQKVANLAMCVHFGLTDDGHFCAYVPESWSSIQFDTGNEYGEFDYGRLILRYQVDGNGVIDNTGRYDDVNFVNRLNKVEQTLYTNIDQGGE